MMQISSYSVSNRKRSTFCAKFTLSIFNAHLSKLPLTKSSRKLPLKLLIIKLGQWKLGKIPKALREMGVQTFLAGSTLWFFMKPWVLLVDHGFMSYLTCSNSK